MAHAAEIHGSEIYDEADEYDRKHGHTTDADAQKPSGLTEASNKPPPADVPFKITVTK